MKLPGVRGVGIGEDADGRKHIRVYSEVAPEKLQGVPSQLAGYLVRVIYTGRIVARKA